MCYACIMCFKYHTYAFTFWNSPNYLHSLWSNHAWNIDIKSLASNFIWVEWKINGVVHLWINLLCIWHPNVSVSTPYLTLDLECCVCIIRVVNGWVDRSNKGGEKKKREMKPGDKSRDWQPGEYLISIDNWWNISSLLYQSQWQPCQFNGCFITGDGPSRTISAQYQCIHVQWLTHKIMHWGLFSMLYVNIACNNCVLMLAIRKFSFGRWAVISTWYEVLGDWLYEIFGGFWIITCKFYYDLSNE